MLDKLHIFICIIAAMVVTIVSIVEHLSLYEMSLRLVFCIIVFYFIGLFVRAYLRKNVFVNKDEESTEASLQGNSADEEAGK